MKQRKIYLSGKISGLTEKEYRDNFARATLDALDFFPNELCEVVNPTNLPTVMETWADYLIFDLMLLKNCNAIVMLPNWKESQGAIVEHEFAKGMGIEIKYL